MAEELKNMQQLLARIEAATDGHKRVTIGLLMEAIGRRSFGPLLLMAGIILFSPLSGVPGMPTTMAMFVLLIAVQVLGHRRYFWLPGWILRRSFGRKSIKKAVRFVQRPARFIDHWTGPRLTFFTGANGVHLIAIFCILIASTTPALEVVPFSATLVGAALTIFGLSVTVHDGLLALVAMLFSVLTLGFIGYYIFG